MAEKDYRYDPVDTGAGDHQLSDKTEKGQLWRQYVIAGVENILLVVVGYNMGWMSPVDIMLRDPEQNPLREPLSINQISWVGSLLPVGAFFSALTGGQIASRIGRKWGLFAAAVPIIIGCIVVLTAKDLVYLYLGRILWGIGSGITYTISPMYCAEIATDDARGALGSYMHNCISIGILIAYTVGPYTSYNVLSYVSMGLLLLFYIAFFFMPESPIYYLTKDDREKAASCLMTLRGRTRAGVEQELTKRADEITDSMQETATIRDVFRGTNFKAFYIAVGLIFFQQVSGVTAVLFYMAAIFEASGSNIPSHVASIIVGAIQVVASGMTPFVVDRLGRRILLLISSCGTGVGLGLLGWFFYLDSQHNPITKSLDFLPIASLIIIIITYCWGLGPLPWAVLGEVFPIEVKAVASPIATSSVWILCFLATRYFGPIAEALGMHVAFWIFSGWCIASFVFVWFLVPETKGKSLQEIQDMLAGRSSKQERA